MIGHVTNNVVWALGLVVVLLIVASLVTSHMRRSRPDKDFSELTLRVRAWWMMVAIFTIAMLLHDKTSLVFLGFVSFLALKEFLSLVPTRRADRRVLFWAYLTIPLQYYWVAIGWYGMFIIFIPVYMFLFLPLRMVLIGDTKNFLRAAGVTHWGLMTTVFSLSHAAYLLALPEQSNPAGGGAGLLLYLVFLTQFNDVMQYVWGKLLGKHKVIPKVSPGKTVEGLLGGVATTVILATLIAPYLTPIGTAYAALAGLIIGLGGFIGDVTLSAIKRDIGVKDSGGLLPGHGGILDRVDSLTFTAPLFFHYVYYLYY